MLLTMVGIMLPQSGKIIIGDVPLTKKTIPVIRQKIGFTFQNADDQLFNATVYDDVAFGPRNYKLSEDEVKKRVDRALEIVGASHLKDRPPYKLSGGEKRSVSIASVLSMEPEIGGGVIINISSIAGLYGGAAGATYTASKHAVVGLTKNTAFMYALKNIRCNAICPGAVATEIGNSEFMKNINMEGVQRTGIGMPLNPRTGEASEIAKVAVFLASDDASFVNGQCIAVDGGWRAY
jgi:NAD(P)-dependent dehydrogenase (short-subunit alcohol dehydrogenase family)